MTDGRSNRTVEETLFQLKLHGWCLVENVIPESAVRGWRRSIEATAAAFGRKKRRHRHSRRPERRPVVRPVPRPRGDPRAAQGAVGSLGAPADRQGVRLQTGIPGGQPARGRPLHPVRAGAHERPLPGLHRQGHGRVDADAVHPRERATVLVPGSHRADNNRTGGLEQPVPHPGQIQSPGRPAASCCSTPAPGTGAAATAATRTGWAW